MPITTSKQHVISADLPTYGGKYAVVPHQFVIDNTIKLLTANGFRIVNELYRATKDGSVAQGIYHIQPIACDDPLINQETELGMMFAWTNSYNKLIKFQCAVGAYVNVCQNGMVCGERNYSRKHVGTAQTDIVNQLSSQIQNISKTFRDIINDRNALKNTTLTKKQQAELLGRLYYDENLLDITNVSAIKEQMNNPSYDYNCSLETGWAFYNHITHVFKTTHPKKWLDSMRSLHNFLTAELLQDLPNVAERSVEEPVENIVEETTQVKETVVEEIYDDLSSFEFEF